MKDIGILCRRFREFGGLRLVWAYLRMGVLPVGIKAFVRCLFSGESVKEIYPAICRKVDSRLLKKYAALLNDTVAREAERQAGVKEEIPHILWTCWLQGEESAPPLVKACWRSQKENLLGYEHRVLTLQNYRQWVALPHIVEEKYRRGIIPAASFSDLLRLAVLKAYGGIWLDATVYCSGNTSTELRERWKAVENSRLTLFRYFNRGSMQASGISAWFIAAPKENVVLSAVLDTLLAYWHEHNCLVDYYIFHLFITAILKKTPRLLSMMPRENSRHSLLLAGAVSKQYDERQWQELASHVCFHKLNYRKATPEAIAAGSYQEMILSKYNKTH